MSKMRFLGALAVVLCIVSLIGCYTQPSPCPTQQVVKFETEREMVRDIRHWSPTLTLVEASLIDMSQLDDFPVFRKGELTSRELVHLDLHLLPLPRNQWFYNWDGTKRLFRREEIAAGTMMLADSLGVVRYKDDCKNRVIAISMSHDNRNDIGQVVPAQPESTSNAGFDWENIFEALGGVLGTIILVLLIIIALVGGIMLLAWLVSRWTSWISEGNTTPPIKPGRVLAAPAPPQPPAPQEHRGGHHVVTRGVRAGEETQVTFRGFDAVNVTRPDGTVNARFETGGNDVIVTG